MSEKLNLPVQNLLKRARETKTQVGLSSLQRKLNIKEAFVVKTQNLKFKTQNIFLVDDVVTTGSTFVEAAKILKKSGAQRVFGITLARD